MIYVKIFQGYLNKIQTDLESFFRVNQHRIDLSTVKISQSENVNGAINLVMLYEI